MFKKSQKKIVAAIMLSLVVLLSITLLAIYLSSYYGIKKDNSDMLKHHVETYSFEEAPGGGEFTTEPKESPEYRPDKPPMDGSRREEPAFELSTFYSVAISKDGEVLKVDRGVRELMDEDELVSYAKEALDSGKKKGKIGDLMYMVDERDDYTLVAFMDNTVTDNSMKTLLKTTLIAGGCAIVVIFFISVFTAKKIVKPLEENDCRQRQFVSDAGHELKTPVSVISANLELLSREIGDNEWLSNIQYENERMGHLVAELLDLSRAQSAGAPKTDVDLSRLVAGEVLPFEGVAFENGQTITTDVEEGVTVEGNASRLGQLTAILIDNAIRHGEHDKEIALTLKKEHRCAVLTVENYADEIPKEKLERIFERFYIVDEARAGEERHYGLGLAIAKAVAESHKGTIAASCADGKVKFTVTLPASKGN